jgi:hypothetical protein
MAEMVFERGGDQARGSQFMARGANVAAAKEFLQVETIAKKDSRWMPVSAAERGCREKLSMEVDLGRGSAHRPSQIDWDIKCRTRGMGPFVFFSPHSGS